ncbi:MAG: hypothetical protein OXL38_17600 [Gammaproteobacteria bacterium]|nr:hypothetical protein [Gammaproteobacteria bacterium]
MSELVDRRSTFMIVMGCNGCGKTAWKRANYDRLPERYFDQDSIAGGIGDWNSESVRARTREFVDAEIAKCFSERVSFGSESTFSGRPGPALLDRAVAGGYRVEGYYIGTESWEINARRIKRRVLANTGHDVDPAELPQRYRWSLSNLRKHLGKFDVVEVVDNSVDELMVVHGREDEPATGSGGRWADGIPDPQVQFVAEKGEITMKAPPQELAAWAAAQLRRLELARQQAAALVERKSGRQDCGRGRTD